MQHEHMTLCVHTSSHTACTQTRMYLSALNSMHLSIVYTPCPQIMGELGHSHIDVLKIDVDGAEWRAFSQMFRAGTLNHVDQIQVELTGE